MMDDSPKRMGRANDSEKLRARSMFMEGKSLREIATEVKRQHTTIMAWAHREEWEKKRQEISKRAREDADLEDSAVRVRILKGLIFAHGRILRRLNELGGAGCDDKDLVEQLGKTTERIAKLCGLDKQEAQTLINVSGENVQVALCSPAEMARIAEMRTRAKAELAAPKEEPKEEGKA